MNCINHHAYFDVADTVTPEQRGFLAAEYCLSVEAFVATCLGILAEESYGADDIAGYPLA